MSLLKIIQFEYIHWFTLYEIAFKFGVNALQLKGVPGHLTPELFVKSEVLLARNGSNFTTFPPREKVKNPELYDLLAEKIRRLEKAYAIESDPARKFQLENQLEEAQNDLKKMIQV